MFSSADDQLINPVSCILNSFFLLLATCKRCQTSLEKFNIASLKARVHALAQSAR